MIFQEVMDDSAPPPQTPHQQSTILPAPGGHIRRVMKIIKFLHLFLFEVNL